MHPIFTDDMRRNPFPLYDQFRASSPLLQIPPPFNGYLIFDYDTVKRVLSDHESFSSRVPAPANWFLFRDPPIHTKLRGLISRAFVPRVITNLEPRIAEISRQLLDRHCEKGEMDLATDYAAPLPMMVIAEMIGIPSDDWQVFRHWSDTILKISFARSGGAEAKQVMADFGAVTAEMSGYLAKMIEHRRASPEDDLLTRLIQAEIDGQRLSHDDILGFFQLLVVGGQETTANLINNAILCLLENPDQLALLREGPHRLPSAIEEALRFRSPLQWVMRTPTREVTIHGQTLAPGAFILPLLGAANHDPSHFSNPSHFDITRHPNPHLSFGHGIHVCLGAALTRLEARIALADLLGRLPSLELASTDPWPPRQALHVHGPASLPIRFRPTAPQKQL